MLVIVTDLRNNIFIKKNILFFFILCISFRVPRNVAAQSTGPPEELTVRAAVSQAMQRSGDIKTINENVSLNERDRPVMWQNMEAAMTGEQMIDIAAALLQMDMQRAFMENSASLTRRMVEMSVIRYFGAVLSVERELNLFDMQMEIARKKLDISKTLHAFGRLDDGAYMAETLGYEREAAGRESKENAVENAYRVLNRLLGVYDTGKRYTLVLNTEYRPLKERYLPVYISDCINNSIRVKNKENDLKTAEFNLNNNRGAGRRADNEAAYRQAERALSDLKKEMGEKIKACYNDIKTLEIMYGIYNLELDKINAQIEITKTLAGLGKAAQLELDSLICQATAVEYAIADLMNDHFIRAMQFDFPDLL